MRSRTGFARPKASSGARRPPRSPSTEHRPLSRPRKSLLSRAIALLARRDHSRAEVAHKLARYADDGDDLVEIQRVLDELERNGLLSDERFAGAVTRTRSHRFGDARIRKDLRRFGVSNEASAAALQALSGSELERGRQVWARRFSALPVSKEERAKQGRFLQSRGFSLETVLAVLSGKAHREDLG